MSNIYPVPSDWAEKAFMTSDGYEAAYRRSLSDPENFWRNEAERIDWMTPFTKVKNTSFNEADFGIKWFEDGVLNVSANCLDRHLPQRTNDVAIIPPASTNLRG